MSNVQLQLASGALSGFASTVCLQPFDLVKTRLQQIDHGLPLTRTGAIDATRLVLSSQGVKGLWRGTSASLIRNVPGVAMYMAGLTQFRTALAASGYFTIAHSTSQSDKSVLPKLTAQGNLIAGATTRVAVGFLLNPISLLKTRFESNLYAYNGVFEALKGMNRSELFRGFLATSLRDAPYAGLFVVFYEGIKRDFPFPDCPPTMVHSSSGAAAGALATLATHPFDVVKTKIQVRSDAQYQSFAQTVATIWKQRGIAGYFDGASLRLGRKVLSSAIGWAVYEGLLIFVRTM
ncbi:mitochondrial carrier [Cylindrobasidium torrendii FP15055 ss-10]|uniref:Mitochondrial glycine transporter n=1 Tax=Cylindrobasidium torrendii FP15055 ss-10 TaxID=1314674 RepID=A0A0D7BRQ5_9AGAR|nr:mitochondrial carrier [Cylindrobasidium torrendii FP15055 ss-10]